MSGFQNHSRAFGENEEGGAAVEFGFLIPFLLLVISGLIDLGLALNQSSALSNAARVGAQYAMRDPTDTEGIAQVVSKAVKYDQSKLTISSSLRCECSDGVAVTCGETCGGTAPQSYITVNVTMPYSSPLPTSLLLGISNLSGTAVFRAN